MTEDALKLLLDRAAEGQNFCDVLFIVPRKDRVRERLHEIFYAAENAGLNPVVDLARQTVRMNDGFAKAYVAVAYPEFSLRFAGIWWIAIDGLVHADPDDAARLNAWIREVA